MGARVGQGRAWLTSSRWWFLDRALLPRRWTRGARCLSLSPRVAAPSPESAALNIVLSPSRCDPMTQLPRCARSTYHSPLPHLGSAVNSPISDASLTAAPRAFAESAPTSNVARCAGTLLLLLLLLKLLTGIWKEREREGRVRRARSADWCEGTRKFVTYIAFESDRQRPRCKRARAGERIIGRESKYTRWRGEGRGGEREMGSPQSATDSIRTRGLSLSLFSRVSQSR